MMASAAECNYAQLRDAFLSGAKVEPESEEARGIVKEWTVCRSAGIAHDGLLSLEDDNPDYKPDSWMIDYRRRLKAYYDNKHAILERIGAVIVYIDDDERVYNMGGDRELGARLRASGLQRGVLFSEKNVGITPVGLSRENPGSVVVRSGAQNYLDIFQGLRFWAHSVMNIGHGSLQTAAVFLEDGSNGDSDLKELLLRYVLEAEDMINTNDLLLPEFKQRHKLAELAASAEQGIAAVVDSRGRLEYITPRFEVEFKASSRHWRRGTPIDECFQSLACVSAALKGKTNIPLREVRLLTGSGKEKPFYVEGVILKTSARVYGMKLTFKSMPEVRKYAKLAPSRNAWYTFDDILTGDARLIAMKADAEKVAQGGSTVLICGESGTGKELFAQALHNASRRSGEMFVPVNCGAIPADLAVSELFGYEEGAFTGARKGGQAGKFEQADRGSIFLDEIGEMPLDLQAMLLRFLEDGVISKVGGHSWVPLDVRVIAATNRNLWENVQERKFRSDLFFRLNVIAFELPPLRERVGDIRLLAKHFATQAASKFDKRIDDVGVDMLELFENYSWPGNIRELRNVMERCAAMASDCVITRASLPFDVSSLFVPVGPRDASQALSLLPSSSGSTGGPSIVPCSSGQDLSYRGDLVSDYGAYERDMMNRLLAKYRGNKSKVAREMGISRSTLYRKMEKFQQSSEEF